MASPLYDFPDMISLWENGEGLFQDSAATTPATSNGDPIGCWQDQIGTHNLIQATTSQRPSLTISTPYKGRPGVTFDHTATESLRSSTFNGTSQITEGCWFIAWYRPRLDRGQVVVKPTNGVLGVEDSSGALLFTSQMAAYEFGVIRDGCYHGKCIVAIYNGLESTPADRFRFRINKEERSLDFSPSNGTPSNITPSIAAGLDLGTGLSGTILELGFMSRVPTQEEIDLWEAYCGEMFFAQGQSKLHVLGDSIPHGYPEHQSDGLDWPSLLEVLLGSSWSVQNVSTIAYTIDQMELQGGAIDQDRDEWRNKDIVILEAGINNLAQGQSGATAIGQMIDSVDARHEFGFTVYVQTLIDADVILGGILDAFGTDQSELDTARAFYNSQVLAGATGANGVFDLANHPGFQPPLLGNINYYQTDLVHTSLEGNQVIAQAAYDLVMGLIGQGTSTALGTGIGVRRGGRP